VEEDDTRAAEGGAVDVGMGGRVAHLVKVEVGLGDRIRSHHLIAAGQGGVD
jgi:hypothetical protein